MNSNPPNAPPRYPLLLFNTGVTLLVVFYSFFQWLFAAPVQTSPNCNIELVLIQAPYLEAVVGVASIVAMFIAGPLVIWLVWNRLFHRKIAPQPLTLGEAYTFYLVLSFLSEFLRHTVL